MGKVELFTKGSEGNGQNLKFSETPSPSVQEWAECHQVGLNGAMLAWMEGEKSYVLKTSGRKGNTQQMTECFLGQIP
jgi:hypothetical protein